MKHEINTWLEDISISIKQIYDFLPADIDYFEFEKDLKNTKGNLKEHRDHWRGFE